MNQFLKIEFFDENGKLLAQFVKQLEERLMIPCQVHPEAKRYRITWPTGENAVGTLIPVYVF